jgi:hypothetical protein
MANSLLKKEAVPFAMVPNELLNDKRISLKAKGLFAFVNSKPENWHFSGKSIASQTGESLHSVRLGLQELELHGYLKRQKSQNSSGFFQVDYYLFFNPVCEIPTSVIPISVKPTSEKPNTGKTANNSNKEVSNKEVSNKEEREGALAFLENNYPSQFETLMMQFKKQINDFVKFSQMYDATVEMEKLEFDCSVLSGRFKKFALNWISNQNRFDAKVISIADEAPKEKIKGFVG